ncbi:P-loop containing nucleoside triphosphate hydrolase protein [Lentithecium fluviatile CBS 122367]|uniref:ATP-dependent RNA helicase n=1 Tax=Lentithecium fluviatile CBS 122367 TaxID=1168545 RepID=A0A6G1IZF1_9PLEO|nr:P-loop containing nucleoside triphosphate hydrolase protein [Lentithecium fluviatile CBS 122367]
MPAPIYSRFVPPKPAIKKHVPSSPQPIPSPPSAQSKKEKKSKSKNRQAHERAGGINELEATLDAAQPAEDTVAESPKAIKKPKKRKREAVADDADAEAEATPKKHKSILSKFEKVSQKAQEHAQRRHDTGVESDDAPAEDQRVLHDLEPLPQPAVVPDPAFEPTFSVLPTWLAQPVIVEASKRVSFAELGVQPFFLKKLEKQGYTDALAVQSALLPMLHPGHQRHIGDICVSARTGSGKTLAYLLPIVEALKDRATPVLSAIVVVPTRKLVDQVLQVAEQLCAGTKIKVATAVGSVPFTTEQKQLVKLRSQYDPNRAQDLHRNASQQLKSGLLEHGIIDDLMTMPIDHVPRYHSAVDILICTPGRLVEHIEATVGFLLRSVKWLVIDEADELLNQDFQGWTTVLMDALHGETPEDYMNVQERVREQRKGSEWERMLSAHRQFTKVVLSATMEKDLTKLGTLRLNRPKLVSVQEEAQEQQPITTDGDVFELPSTLEEFAVPVGEGQKKPLYLLYLLLNHAFKADEEGNDSSDSSESDPDSSSSSSSSSSSDDDATNPAGGKSIVKHASRVLVFTRSNESASRLSHLISVLEPSFKDYLKTMTPSSTAKAAKKLLKSFSSGSIKILIASDAASRGLDIPDISHVINYDIPSSVTSYVHRVGRTARANKAGEAWTLFTKSEAAWFWNQIARGEKVRRSDKKVTRIEWKEREVTWDRKRTYEAALAELQEAVVGPEATN